MIIPECYPYANQELPATLAERIRCQNGKVRLDLSNCNITKIPLQAINDNYDGQPTQLYLSYNAITFISPKFTVDMIHLKMLDLSNNSIKRLPDNFGTMLDLTYLDLHRNCLKTLPASMGNMRRLSFLCLSGNPLQPPLCDFAGNQEMTPLVLAELVVQFLQEFRCTLAPENRQSEASMATDKGGKRKVHNRSTGSTSSLNGRRDSNDSLYYSKLDCRKKTREDVTKVLTVSWNGLCNLFIIGAIFALTLLIFAYFVDTSFMEMMAKQCAYFDTIWKTLFKRIYPEAEYATASMSKPTLWTLNGPPPNESRGGFLGQIKTLFVNVLTKVGVN